MKLITRIFCLLLAIVLCAFCFTACDKSDPAANGAAIGNDAPSSAPPSSEPTPTAPIISTAAEAFALFAAVEQASESLSSITAETVMDMTFYLDALTIVSSGVSQIKEFDSHGSNFAFLSSQATSMEIRLDGETVTSSTMETKEGFRNGTMFYSFSETEDGIQTVSNQLKSTLTADEYRAYMKEIHDSMPEITAETCKKASYKKNENGIQTAVFSSFNNRGMRWLRDQLQGLDALLEDGVTLKDMTCTLVADANNLPISLEIECKFSSKTVSQKLPELSLYATYSLPNATEAPVISTNGYTEVDDLRILERLEKAIDRHLYNNTGSYVLESIAAVTVGNSAPEVIKNSENGAFSTVNDKFIYAGTSIVNDLEMSMRYENGSCEITMDGESESIEYTDEEMRDILRNGLDPASFSKGNVINIQKSMADSGTYILSLTNSERVETIRSTYDAMITDSSETLTVRLNADGELIEISYQLNATMSSATYGTIQVSSSAGIVITLD